MAAVTSLLALVIVASACGAAASPDAHAPASTTSGTTALAWTHASVSSGPSRRDTADVASTKTGVLVFGGETTAFGSTYLDDTWSYSNGSWKQLKLSVHPPGLISGGIAYDPLDDTAVLFGGGNSGGTCTSATWTFSASTWKEAKESTSPPARYVGGMAFSPLNKGILMFGGQECNAVAPSPVNDTWLWTPSGWRHLHPAHSPPAVGVDGMAADPATNQVVLLTAMNTVSGSKVGAGETWVWNGKTWLRSSSAPTPADRWGSAMAYDPALREVVVFGGSDRGLTSSGNLNDAWGWTGSSWKRLTEAAPPPAEVFAGMAYDPSAARLLLLQEDAAPATSTWLARS
jgi:hypothetical protein